MNVHRWPEAFTVLLCEVEIANFADVAFVLNYAEAVGVTSFTQCLNTIPLEIAFTIER